MQLDAAQERNLREALSVTSDEAQQLRLAFGIWTESRGYNYANDGRNTSNSPGVTPAIAAILRGSLDIPHDLVGSNGRSTGVLQQTSSNVGGGWGSMVGTMQPATAALRFLDALRVSNDPTYTGTLLTPTGSKKVTVKLSDPIAADVLRVQQPLADEATSSNYDASQVAIARQIVAQYAPKPEPTDDWMDLLMADQQKLDEYKEQIAQAVQGKLSGINENAGETRRITGVLAGVTALAGNGEKSVEQQVFEHELPNGVGKLGNFLAELNRKIDLNAEVVARIEAKLNKGE